MIRMRKIFVNQNGPEIYKDLMETSDDNLIEINIETCLIGNYWMQNIIRHHMKSYSLLEHLNISNTDIDSETVTLLFRTLSSFPRLKVLKCSGVFMVTNNIISLLSQKNSLQNVQEIDFSHNFLDNLSAFYLAKALCSMKKMKALNLSYNNISDMGLRYIAKAFTHIEHLESLQFKFNVFGLDEIERFIHSLSEHHCKTIRVLDFSHVQDFYCNNTTGVTRNNLLSTIARDISTFEKIDSFGWCGNDMNQSLMNQMNKIQSLFLNFTNNSFSVCPDLPNIKKIEVNGWNSNDLSLLFCKLNHIKNLSSISVNFVQNMDHLVSFFSKWESLRFLSISNCKLDDNAVEEIIKGKTQLLSLNLSHNCLTNRIVPFVKKHGLKYLNIRGNSIETIFLFEIIEFFLESQSDSVELLLDNGKFEHEYEKYSQTWFVHKNNDIQKLCSMVATKMKWDNQYNRILSYKVPYLKLDFEIQIAFSPFLEKYLHELESLQDILRRKQNYFQFNRFLQTRAMKNHCLNFHDIQVLIAQYL